MTVIQQEDRDRYTITWTNKRTGQGFRREATGEAAANVVIDLATSDAESTKILVEREHVASRPWTVRYFDMAGHLQGRGTVERRVNSQEEARALADDLRTNPFISGIQTVPLPAVVKTERRWVLDGTGRPR